MSNIMRREVETKIISALITEGIANGYKVMVDNDEGILESDILPEILSSMFVTDEEILRFYKDGRPVGWVYLVYGNDGWDVISDYSYNLDHIMGKANEISNYYSG